MFGFEVKGLGFWVEAGVGVFVKEGELGAGFFAGKGGGKGSHLDWTSKEEALADAHVYGVTAAPGFADTVHFPFRVWDDHSATFVGEFDVGFFVKAEAFGFLGEDVDTEFEGDCVVVDVTGDLDGAFEVDFTKFAAVVFFEEAVTDEVGATAVEHFVRVDDVVAQASDCGDDFKGGGRRVETLGCAVDPGGAGVDVVKGFLRDEGGEVVEVEGWGAGHGEDFAGFDFYGNDCAFFVA